MKPYHKNPRQITRKQMDNLRLWLAELGDLSGIVHDLNTDEIIGGNQRGMVFDVNKCEVELIDGPHEPDEQGTVAHGFIVWKGARYAYRQVRWDDKQAEKANIVANKAGGGWDFDTLANEFEVSDLIEWGFEAGELGLDLTGGTDDDAEPQIDRAEELREQWGVEPGQMWRLPSRTPGQEHRLICGDCTDAAVVERVMGGERAVVISDPPYGVAVVQNNSVGGENLAPVGFYHPVIGDDSIEAAKRFYAVCLELGLNDIILWGGNYFSEFLPSKAGWIVWDKRGDIPSNNFADCELAWTSRDAPARVYKQVWMGMVKERESGKRVHPTQKPVELIQFCMGLFDAPIVFDGFLGSGTTIIAAENLSRQCRAVEISPAYVAVALQRYVDAFGIEPELIAVETVKEL